MAGQPLKSIEPDTTVSHNTDISTDADKSIAKALKDNLLPGIKDVQAHLDNASGVEKRDVEFLVYALPWAEKGLQQFSPDYIGKRANDALMLGLRHATAVLAGRPDDPLAARQAVTQYQAVVNAIQPTLERYQP